MDAICINASLLKKTPTIYLFYHYSFKASQTRQVAILSSCIRRFEADR